MTDQAAHLRALVRGRRAGSDEPSRSGPRLIAVSSGKGGVGKTNLAVNLGILMAQAGKRTAILDADLGLANVDVLLGLNPRYTLSDVIYEHMPLEEIIIDGPHGVKIIPGASGLEAMASLTDDQRMTLIDGLTRLAHDTDIILIDTAAGIGRDVSRLIVAAREVLVILTPEPTALTDAYALIKVVAAQAEAMRFMVVVNLADNAAQAAETVKKLNAVAQRFLGLEVADYGYLPRDSAVQQAVMRQTPVVVAYPKANVSGRLRTLCARLLGNAPPPEPSVIGRFVQRLTQPALRTP